MIRFAPFAGVVEKRPYPPTGLTTRLWQDVEPLAISFSRLWLTQAYVHIDTIFASENHPSFIGDKYPHVVRWEDKLYLEDGHNRLTRLALRGLTSAMCRVYEVP